VPNLSLTIDIVPATLLISAAFSAGCLVLADYFRRAVAHLRFWAVGGFAFALAMLLIVLRGSIPDPVSVLVANLLFITGFAALGAGTSAFIKRSFAPDIVLGIVGAGAFAVCYVVDADFETRVTVVSATTTVHALYMIHGFLKAPPGFGVHVALATLVSTTMLSLLRIVVVHGPAEAALPNDSIHAGVLGLAVMAAFGIAVALGVLNLRVFLGDRADPVEADDESWRLARARFVLVSPSGIELRLTGNELLILQEMGSGSPVPRTTLNTVIGRDAENPKDRGIDILISRLRRKCLEAGVALPVTSVRGRGYVFHGALLLS
jgi:hypothetical protein